MTISLSCWRRFVIGAKTKVRIEAKLYSKHRLQIRASEEGMVG